jgi:hypothetical protein
VGPLEAVRRRLEVLHADIATLERMLPPDAEEELVDHIGAARKSILAALAVFKKRDRDVRETFGFKR